MLRRRFAGGIALVTATTAAFALGCSPADDAPLPAAKARIMFADPSHVASLGTRTMTSTDTGRRIHITYPTLRNDPELAHRLRAEAAAQLRAFIGATTSRSDEGDPRRFPEFNIDWQFPAVSARVLGVRLATTEFDGSEWRNYQHTVWYDRTAHRAAESADLLDGQAALATAAALARNRLLERGQDKAAAAVRPDRDLFDAVAFNPKGDLVAEFDDHELGPESHARMVVSIPREKATPLLSPMGLLAREAAETAVPEPVPPMREFTKERPRAQSTRFGTVDCAKVKCLALSFEDGPGRDTPRLLAALAMADARATFFVTGSNAVAQPAMLRRMADEGHLVANHTWSHRDLVALSASRAAAQLSRTQDAVYMATGQSPTILRPPYGSSSAGIDEIAQRMGLSVVRGNVDTMDRNSHDTDWITRRAVDAAKPNSVIWLHDIYGASVDAVPGILDQLSRQGYVFVTIPELPGSHPVPPYYASEAAAKAPLP